MKKIYVALLRGINVGGKNKVDMKQLKKTFENTGMDSVKTYINSGNILFMSSKDNLAKLLEKAIYKDFSLKIKVVIRSYNDFKILMKSLPKKWKNDETMKSDVMFLWEEVDKKSVLNALVIKKGIDTVKYVPGTVLWSVDRKSVTKSGLMRLAGMKLYQHMTIRNVNTTRKIYDLMKEMEKDYA